MNLRRDVFKKGWCSLAFFCINCMALCYGAGGNSVGQIDAIRTHDANQYPNWAPPKFWFSLKNVTTASGCPKYSNGEVLFVGTDKAQLSFILSAQATGQKVDVSYDDTLQINGFCQVVFVTIGN